MNIFVEKKHKEELKKLISDNNICINEAKRRFLIVRSFTKIIFLCKIFFSRRKQERDGMLGVGTPDYTEIYKTIQDNVVVSFVVSGITWDLIKLTLNKIYFVFKSRKKYVEIIDEFHEPGSCHVIKFLIPLDLDLEKINHVLTEAEEISNSFEKIRFYFRSKKIIFKYKKYWRIKIKKYF